MSTFLLYSTSTELRRINMDPAAGLDHSDSIIPLTSIGHVIGLDFDAEEDFIYFSDTSRKTISRAKWDGTQERVTLPFLFLTLYPSQETEKGDCWINNILICLFDSHRFWRIIEHFVIKKI